MSIHGIIKSQNFSCSLLLKPVLSEVMWISVICSFFILAVSRGDRQRDLDILLPPYPIFCWQRKCAKKATEGLKNCCDAKIIVTMRNPTTFIHAYIYTYVWIYVCVYIYIYVCVFLYIRLLCWQFCVLTICTFQNVFLLHCCWILTQQPCHCHSRDYGLCFMDGELQRTQLCSVFWSKEGISRRLQSFTMI